MLKTVLALALLSCGLSFAQSKKADTALRPRHQSAAASNYSKDPFDVDQPSVAAGYKGHSCTTLAQGLKSHRIEKDEFETTDAFNLRLAAINSQKVLSNLAYTDAVAFVKSPAHVDTKYDADANSLKLSVMMLGRHTVDRSKIPATRFNADLLDRSERKVEQYEAQNGFGARTTVTKTVQQVCAVVFSNLPRKPGDSYEKTLSTNVPMPPDLARKAKDKIGMVYVGHLDKPYIQDYSDALQASYSSPTETYWLGDAVIMNLDAIWFYLVDTGEVLTKMSLN